MSYLTAVDMLLNPRCGKKASRVVDSPNHWYNKATAIYYLIKRLDSGYLDLTASQSSSHQDINLH
jgi:hypothetical protein